MRLLAFIGALLAFCSIGLKICKQEPAMIKENGYGLMANAGNTYFGPKKRVSAQLVRVDVIMRDSPESAGPKLSSVEFNGQSIPLKPVDIHGGRGSGAFQLRPGKYKLRWTVNLDQHTWPRNVTHEEEVDVSPRDLWIQITVEGENASIT